MAFDSLPEEREWVWLRELCVRQTMRGTRFPPLVAIRIVASLCGRLHAEHVRKDDSGNPLGIVHGSVTLHTVLVARTGQVFVMPVPPDLALRPSPEQAAGFAATPRSDVFGAGMVLYELLTGDNPLEQDDPAQTREATLEAALPPPSQLTNLPESLDAVVMRAVARDASERYPDAKAMQAALEKVLEAPGWLVTAADVARYVEDLKPRAGPQDEPTTEEVLAAFRALSEAAPRPRVEADCLFVGEDDWPAVAEAPEALQHYRELEALGFTRLGMKLEINKANGRRVYSMSYASEAQRAFASVFFSSDGMPAVYFLSYFEDDTMVLTSAYERTEHRKPRAVLTGHPRQPLEKVLEAHRREVDALVARGLALGSDWSREARLRVTHAYYANDDTR